MIHKQNSLQQTQLHKIDGSLLGVLILVIHLEILTLNVIVCMRMSWFL